MKKKALNPMVKLYSAVILVVISVSLMVSVTFAWFTVSRAPEVGTIQVTIGGTDTIKIAPNVTTTYTSSTDASVVVPVNYPGQFDDYIDFSKISGYRNLSGYQLTPVSTADGINWFFPKIDEETGEMVVESLDDFTHVQGTMGGNKTDGGYIYMDFWLLSPLENTTVRICSGDSNEDGSYVVELPQAVKSGDSKHGYALDDSNDSLASSLRVGFLVNDEQIIANEPMLAYQESIGYWETANKLKGAYASESGYSFVIYEPNGLVHGNQRSSIILTSDGIKTVACKDGEYWITHPIGLNYENDRELINIADRLLVQKSSGWKKNVDDDSLMLNDLFQSYIKDNNDLALHELEETFYSDYVNTGYLQYINTSEFFENTWELYWSGDLESSTQEDLADLGETNAVLDNYIVRLEKNVPQRVRMFIWMEGQDVDCSIQAAAQTVAVRLELAGSTGD